MCDGGVERFVRDEHVIWDMVDGECTLCDARSGEIFLLNPTAQIVWSACENAAADELDDTLHQAFPTQPIDRIRQDVRHLISTLKAGGLIRTVQSPPAQNPDRRGG